MANHLQAKKRARQNEKRMARNRHFRSTLRTHVKQVRAHLAAGEAAPANEALRLAIKHLDRAVTKGILHRRTASRMISRLTVAVGKLS